MVEGKLQREGEVVHIIAQKLFDYTKLLKVIATKEYDQLPLLSLSPTSEYKGSAVKQGKPEEVFYEGRNFK